MRYSSCRWLRGRGWCLLRHCLRLCLRWLCLWRGVCAPGLCRWPCLLNLRAIRRNRCLLVLQVLHPSPGRLTASLGHIGGLMRRLQTWPRGRRRGTLLLGPRDSRAALCVGFCHFLCFSEALNELLRIVMQLLMVIPSDLKLLHLLRAWRISFILTFLDDAINFSDLTPGMLHLHQ